MEDNTVVFEEGWMQQGFVSLPRVVLFATDISVGAKLTYAVLLSYAWDKGSCFPGQEEMAKHMGIRRQGVNEYLGDLQRAGYISIARHGMGATNTYTLHKLATTGQIDVRKTGHQSVRYTAHQSVRKTGHKVEAIELEADELETTSLASLTNEATNLGGADAPRRDDWSRIFALRCAASLGWEKPNPKTIVKIATIVFPLLDGYSEDDRLRCLDWMFSNGYLRERPHVFMSALSGEILTWINAGKPSSKKNGSARGGGKTLTGSAAHRMDWDMSLPEQRAMLEEETRGANVCPDCGITQGRHIAWCAVKPEGAEIVPDPFADPTDKSDPLYQPLRRS